MRRTIFHIITTLHVGGTERQLTTLATRLPREDWEQKIICFRKAGVYLDDVRAAGLEPDEVSLNGGFAQWNTAKVIAGLAARFRAEGASVVHCHDFYAVVIGVPAARLAGIPVIAARRDLAHHLGKGKRMLLRAALKGATVVLANAATVAAQAEAEDGVSADRLVVIPNGLDLEAFDRAAAAPLERPLPEAANDASPLVLTVGGLKHVVKGHDDLLEAIALTRRVLPGARFAFAGDGPREEELKAMAARLGVADSVLFLGKRSDVPALLARADMIVHPARMEGLPNAVLEALAAGKPVIATTAGGTPELLHDDAHGVLVPVQDPARMAEAICHLAADPARAARLAAAARARVVEHFSVSTLVSRTESLYRRLIGDRLPLSRPAQSLAA